MALDFPTNPTDGQIYGNYQYDNANNVWKLLPAPLQQLNNLGDVEVSSPSSGEALIYDGTQWVNGPRSGNAIINGDFGVWQRGTSLTGVAAKGYLADRWNYRLGGSRVVNVSRETFPDGQTDVPGGPTFFHRIEITTAGTVGMDLLQQRIEDSRKYAGRQVTVSFYAKADKSVNINADVGLTFGSGGSSFLSATEQVASLTVNWQKFVMTFDFPSDSGSTYGTVGTDFSFFRFNDADGSLYTFDLAQVQLEAGPVATPFKLAGGGSKGAELALCQRYYYVHANHTDGNRVALGAGGMFSDTQVEFTISAFPTTMRTLPSFLSTEGPDFYRLLGNFAATTFDEWTGTVWQSPNTVLVYYFGLEPPDTEGDRAGKYARVGTSENGAYIAFDAEL